MSDRVRIGLDLGGTKIEGILLVGSNEILRLRVPTPREDYRATVEAVASLAQWLERQRPAPAPGGPGRSGAPGHRGRGRWCPKSEG